jgi:gamma-glutamyltranspeptidase/glutathione hydrolase
LAPAINLALKGFRINADLANEIESEKAVLAKHPSSARIFVKKDGTPFKEGDVLVQHDLGVTLERIAARGRDGFYDGPTADLIVAEMQRGGGLITKADLKDYKSVWREPVLGEYRGYEIASMPPPSSGGALLVEMLNMIEPYDLRAMGFGSADAIHLMIEAERRAYADRAQHLGDSDFYPVPLATLIDKAYAKSRFADFDPKHASASTAISPGQIAEHPNTTHISVMDGKGDAVAYTTTLNLSYGSKIVVDGAGFLLNDEMDDFSSKENTPNAYGLLGREANEIAPGKRMLSSMTPTIVLDEQKQPMLVTGSPGGSTIITTVLQVVVNVIDHQMSVADAVGAPRFHHQWMPDRVVYERYGISPDTLAMLRERGHQNVGVLPFDRGIGDANSVMRVGTLLYGISDPREQGGAVGY